MPNKETRQEFIGKKVSILQAAQKEWIGKQCEIVDETKNTFSVLHNDKIKKVLKKGFAFIIQGTNLIINGKDLLKRPEDRIKGN